MATKTGPSKQDRLDVKLASSLVLNPLLADEGIQALQQAMQSATDPATGLAMAVFQAIGQVRDQAAQRGVPLSDRIWTARGGVLDTVIENVCQVLASVPPEMPEATSPEFMQDVKEEVWNLMEEQEGAAEPGRGATGGMPPEMGAPQQQPPSGPPQAGLLSAGGM
jgi:hypothetical protein